MMSNYTQLETRKLWYDGSTSIDPRNLIAFIQRMPPQIDTIFVDEVTQEIAQDNRLVDKESQIQQKIDINPLKFDWNLPEAHRSIDVVWYVMEKLDDEVRRLKLNHLGLESRKKRVSLELERYGQLKLFPILSTMIHVVEQFKKNNIVWGVGRGSSVASYVLYLIGVHDIDSVAYDLHYDEFLRNKTN